MIKLPPAHIKSFGVLFEDYNFIYLNIAKSASTTIKTIMGRLTNLDVDGAKTVAELHKLPFNRLPVNWRKKYPNTPTFSIVRNPWARLFSCYNNHIRSEKINEDIYVNGVFRKYEELYPSTFWAGMTFSEFAEIVCQIPDAHADYHFRSQYCVLINDVGHIDVTYLGRLENMANDFRRIGKKIGLPEHIQIEHKNQTHKASYTEHYSFELKEKVAKRYSVDIELFGYEFDQINDDIAPQSIEASWKASYSPEVAAEVYQYAAVVLEVRESDMLKRRKNRKVKHRILFKIKSALKFK